MAEIKKEHFLCEPPEPWFKFRGSPALCHKWPNGKNEPVILKALYLTKHDKFYSFTVKCDYGPYAYFKYYRRNYSIVNSNGYVIEANIGEYYYRQCFDYDSFEPFKPGDDFFSEIVQYIYRELLSNMNHSLHRCSMKVEWNEEEIKKFRIQEELSTMGTVKQIMEAFPDNCILLRNDATDSQISSGTMMTSKEMIHILSEEILNHKVDRYENKEIDGNTFTVIHISV